MANDAISSPEAIYGTVFWSNSARLTRAVQPWLTHQPAWQSDHRDVPTIPAQPENN